MKKTNDLTGKVFERLTVLRIDTDRVSPGRKYYICKCKCGNEKSVRSDALLNGMIKSCGCLHKETAQKLRKGKYNDLSNKKFGRLTVIDVNRNEKGKMYWNCICDCGNKTVVMYQSLKDGDTQSCGCLQKEKSTEVLKKVLEKRIEKGEFTFTGDINNRRILKIWIKMNSRCYKEYDKQYFRYGGRGISIHPDWQKSNKYGFINFANWSFENGYDDKLTIDRTDNNGNYEPSNCRWVDMKTQSNNRRSNRAVVLIDDDNKVIKRFHNGVEAAEYYNIDPRLISNCCRRKHKCYKLYKFRYADDEDIIN